MEPDELRTPPELPEGRPLPYEANPGGIEGADPGWVGGSSELLGPEPDVDTTYSTRDVGSAGRQEKVGPFHCFYCGRAFERPSEVEAHQRTAHPKASAARG
jgi:hypothetical protein